MIKVCFEIMSTEVKDMFKYLSCQYFLPYSFLGRRLETTRQHDSTAVVQGSDSRVVHSTQHQFWTCSPKVGNIWKVTGLCNNMNRSRHQKSSVKKRDLTNFAKFTAKHLSQRLFFNKVAGLRPATLLKKDICSPVNLASFFCFSFDVSNNQS